MWDGERVRHGETVSVDILELTDSAEESSSGSMDEQKGKWRLKAGFGGFHGCHWYSNPVQFGNPPMFLAWLTPWPWRRRWYIPPNVGGLLPNYEYMALQPRTSYSSKIEGVSESCEKSNRMGSYFCSIFCCILLCRSLQHMLTKNIINIIYVHFPHSSRNISRVIAKHDWQEWGAKSSLRNSKYLANFRWEIYREQPSCETQVRWEFDIKMVLRQ